MLAPLPIDPHVSRIVDAVRQSGSAVVVAAPGAGKTTRVPPALVDDGPLILLQPRRVAARALARRIASERDWSVGREIGWQVRFERRFSRDTRLLVATEGVLTARLQSDPLLEGFRTVVLDEFHERSLHADLALALTRQAALARDDLRIVVMSATLEAGRVAAFLEDAPVIEVPGRAHPLEIEYEPHADVSSSVLDRLADRRGHVLVFLPGSGEIERTSRELKPRLPADARVFPLHGSLGAERQDAALAPFDGRKVVLATNLAETSLTVDGVTDVIDTGRHRTLRLDPTLGLDRLVLERIPQDAADQRAGRAGRTGPGHVVRLWDARDELQPHRDPEIRRVDLVPPFLSVLAWGEDPRSFEWFESPERERTDLALELLVRLGAMREGSITPLGRALARLPLHPRLGRVLLGLSDVDVGAAACAILAEGWLPLDEDLSTACDLLPLIDRIDTAPRRVREAARQLRRRVSSGRRTTREPDVPSDRTAGDRFSGGRDSGDTARAAGNRATAGGQPDPTAGATRAAWTGRAAEGADERTVEGQPSRGTAVEPSWHVPGSDVETRLCRALWTGYPDRAAVRRESGSTRLLLANGHGAELSRESGVRDGEFLVALELRAAPHGSSRPSWVRAAARIEPEWLEETDRRVEHELERETGRVRAVERRFHRRLPLGVRPVDPDPEIAATLLRDAMLERGLGEAGDRLLARLRFAGASFDLPATLLDLCRGRKGWFEPELKTVLPWEARDALRTAAPETLEVPSGRTVRLDYRDDETVVAAVKLQELFGLADTPRIGPGRVPVTFELLAPSGRPVQTTRDLRSFWNTTYADVRKELRGRYPKHPWPEDPWSATPTARAKPRKKT